MPSHPNRPRDPAQLTKLIVDYVCSSKSIAILLGLCLSACDNPSNEGKDVYTLYRGSIAAPGLRVHIATFDVDEGSDYNRDNCETAATLFANYPGNIVPHWCEKGRYRPQKNSN